jgi:hypothetical protein
MKDHVRSAKLSNPEMMLILLAHAPGKAHADSGEARVVIAGVEQKAHYLAMDLRQSDDGFIAAFRAETTIAFLEGHVPPFGAVPSWKLRDDAEIALTRILSESERQKARAASELQSYYLFAYRFGRSEATTKAGVRVWSAMRGGSSWLRLRECQAGDSRALNWKTGARSRSPLQHHLKAVRMPTILRQHEGAAPQS